MVNNAMLRQAAIVLTAALLVATNVAKLTYNTTASLPTGIYQIRDLPASPRRGDVVGFCLVGEAARVAVRRGYVHAEGLEPFVYGKHCGEGVGAIGKPIAGLPGDTVDVAPGGVNINGMLLSRSRVPVRDRAGRALNGVQWGRTILGPDEFWVQSQYAENSFDSRLYGSVRISDMLDRRVLILPARYGWAIVAVLVIASICAVYITRGWPTSLSYNETRNSAR